MFSATNLYGRPLIQMRQKFRGDLPEYFENMHSPQFWFFMQEDMIEKMVAMRVYPYQNCIAIKFRLIGQKKYTSVMLKNPELRILKHIWDCDNSGFNCAIKYYILYSNDAFQQWATQAGHSHGCFNWYRELNADAE